MEHRTQLPYQAETQATHTGFVAARYANLKYMYLVFMCMSVCLFGQLLAYDITCLSCSNVLHFTERHDVQLHARPSSTVPDDFCHPASSVASRQQLRSASRRLLVVPRCRLNTTARRAFFVVGPSVWNSLPDYLRDSGVGRDTF